MTKKSISWANSQKRKLQTIDGVADGQTSVTTFGVPTSLQVDIYTVLLHPTFSLEHEVRCDTDFILLLLILGEWNSR